MRIKRFLPAAMSAFFAFLFGLGAVGCLVSGFDLPVASRGRLILFLLLFSVLPPLLLSLRHGVWGFLALFIQSAYWLWQDGALWDQLKSVGYLLSSHYHRAFDWTIIGESVSEKLDLVFLLVAFLVSVGVGLCVFFRLHNLYVFLLSFPVLVLTLITGDTTPDSIFLYFILLGVVLLLFLDWTQWNNSEESVSVLLRIAVPAAAALGVLFALNPQSEYVNRADALSDRFSGWFEQIENSVGELSTGGSGVQGDLGSDLLNLRYIGAKSNWPIPVMQVTADFDGTVYLRGRDYDIYTGTVWEASIGREELFTLGSGLFGTVNVTTYGAKDILYLPYYSTDTVRFLDGCLKNEKGSLSYGYFVSQKPKKNPMDNDDYYRYSELPSSTRQWAEPLISDIVSGDALSVSEIAADIGDFVRRSASYDLNPSVMNSSYADFAQWFLEKSDTGYCIHFATTAAVLLRAAGIPARYVEGYMTHTVAGEEVVVTAKEAHAWVEYYDGESSVWVILEATPSLDNEAEQETLPETELDETESVGTDGERIETEREETSADIIPETENPNFGDAPQSDHGAEGKHDFASFFRIFGKVLLTMLSVSLVPLQGELRIAFSRRRWGFGTPNQIALYRYRLCRRWAKSLKKRMPETLEALALKAKYSQHTLTEEELERFDQFRETMVMSVNALPLPRRLLKRWIFAAG